MTPRWRRFRHRRRPSGPTWPAGRSPPGWSSPLRGSRGRRCAYRTGRGSMRAGGRRWSCRSCRSRRPGSGAATANHAWPLPTGASQRGRRGRRGSAPPGPGDAHTPAQTPRCAPPRRRSRGRRGMPPERSRTGHPAGRSGNRGPPRSPRPKPMPFRGSTPLSRRRGAAHRAAFQPPVAEAATSSPDCSSRDASAASRRIAWRAGVSAMTRPSRSNSTRS